MIIDDFYVFFSLLDDETTRKFGEIVRDRDVVFCSTPYRFEWILQNYEKRFNELAGGLEKCKVVFLISDEKHSLEIVTENYRGRYSDKELDNIIKKCKKHLDKTLVEFSLRGEKYRSYVPWLLIAWN